MPCSPMCLSLIIECCYNFNCFWDAERSNIWCASFFKQYTGVEEIARKLLPYYEKNLGYLISLLCDNINVSKHIWNDISADMRGTVKRFGDQLFVKVLKKIKRFGELIHSRGIGAEVEKVLSRNL